MTTIYKFNKIPGFYKYECTQNGLLQEDNISGEYVSLSDYNRLLRNRDATNDVMTQAAQRMEEYRQEVKNLKSNHKTLQVENAGLQQVVEDALETAQNIDGAHHKQWIIDQMVRILTNCPIIKKEALDYKGNPYSYQGFGESIEYTEWVRNYQDGEDGPNTYEWDTGIAP